MSPFPPLCPLFPLFADYTPHRFGDKSVPLANRSPTVGLWALGSCSRPPHPPGASGESTGFEIRNLLPDLKASTSNPPDIRNLVCARSGRIRGRLRLRPGRVHHLPARRGGPDRDEPVAARPDRTPARGAG